MDDEAIAMFCSITGADEADAAHFLEASDGNVEVAVGLFMDSNGKAPAGKGPQVVEEEVRRPIAPTRGVLIDAGNDYEGEHAWVDPRSAAAMRRPIRAPFASFADTVDLSTERGRRLACLFKAPVEINFVGSFDAARKEAKKQERYLLVSLHDASEFPCQMLNRDLWNHEDIQAFVQDQLVFLQLDTSEEEGERYMRHYAFVQHPHIALIDPRTGRSALKWEGRMPTPAELMGDVLEYAERHPLRPVIEMDADSVADREAAVQSSTRKEPAKIIIPAEPPADSPDVTTVQFRMPDGSRLRRRFLLSSPLSLLFDFAADALSLPARRIDILSHAQSLSQLAPLTTTLEDAAIRNSALNVTLLDPVDV